MIRAALKNPHLVIVLALAALVIGTESYRKIPADLLPIFDTPAVQIVTFYPGMPPEVMERDIMSRLERWTGQSVGIEHQEGKAMLGVSIVKDFFREGISLETAMSQVTSYAVSDMFYLPPGTIPPMVMPFDPTASVPLCLVSVSNLGLSEKELYNIAYFELRNRLQAIPGVIAPAVYGGKLRRILAYVEREKLEARGLSLMDVQRALVEQNVLIPAGSAKIGEVDYQVFTNSIPELVSSMNDTPLGVVDGAPVLLKDVGEVRDAGQIQTNIVRTNGARQVYIPIYRQPGANTIAIVDAITGRLDQILARLKEMNAGDPKMQGLILSVVMDQSIGVRKSIGDLQLAAGLGALLAGLVVLLFLRNLGMTLVIMLAIPLSILVAVIGLFFTGDTINAMTLGGLALAVGILVDQAIVVMENIVRHADLGKSPFDAALDGAKEVAMPIFVSTVTFVVVFYPVVFLSGLARFLFTPLAVAASVAIIGSYLVALTLVPAYCARFLRRTAAQRDVGSNAAGGFYDRVLGFLLRRRRTTVLAALALLAGAILMLPALGTELFPQVDPGQFTLTVRLPAGTRIERTEEMVAAIERSLIQEIGPPDPGFALGAELHPESDLQILISNIGVLMDWPAAYTPNVGPMDAFILVQLKGKAGHGTAFDLVQRLRRRLSSEFPAAEFAFDTGGMMSAALNFGEPSPIHFQVTGSKLDVAQSIARVIARVARDVAGAEDVRIAQRQDYPILEFEIDRALAATQGVSTSDVMKNLVSATNSSINFEPAFWIDQRNGNHYFMGVQYHEQDIESLEALRNIPITGRDSVRPVLLRNVATMKPKLGPSVINHHNITRATDVYVNVRAGFATGSVAAEIEKRLAREPDLGVVARATEEGRVLEVGGPDYAGKGYLIEMQGEVRDMRESFAQFAAGLLIAVILVYLVMVAQFRSFVDPLVILLTVPLGFIGVVAALWATDTALSIMVFMGIIMMVGIVVEYSIVLVHFANQRLAEGAAPAGAIAEAARVRLRPILMTSATTVLALLPMAIGLGGGGANVPLARTIVGGVIAATILALLVVPCLYVMGKGTRRRALPLPHLGLCLLIPASGLACERPENATTGTRAEAASTAEPAPLVDTLVVRAEDLAWTVIVPGSVQAIEAADLFGKLGGYLERVAVDIGDQVEAGQTLATIRVPEMLAESRAIAAEVELTRRLIAQESAAVARAEAAVATAETELPRLAALRREKEAELALRRVELERLVQLTTEAKSIELRRVDEARFRFEAAEAALALAGAERPAADARIGEAQAAVMKARADRRVAEARLAAATADLATQSELLAYATIRAPFAGIITERHLHAGAFVRPATTNGAALPVLRIERIDQVRVSAHIAMDSLASLEVGDRVVFDGIQAAPELRLEGAISRLEGALDPRSRMMRIEADFSNPADGAGARRLRPGFYGQLTIILEDYPETPTVPAAAVFTRDGTDFVFTVEDGIARLRPISILFQDGGRVGIEAGVAVGQQVVAQRVATLQDGQRVRTKPLGAAVR